MTLLDERSSAFRSSPNPWVAHRRRAGLLMTCVLIALAGCLLPVPNASAAPHPAAPTVIGKRVLGHSVAGRPIVAYRLGDPTSPLKAVVLGQMHGDEHAGVVVVSALLRGRPVVGMDLWVVPTLNPDGNVAHRRQNAHGVDLNRNWPNLWSRATGRYGSGAGPLSEPETRAMYAFLRGLRPTLLVSLHQPLDGVDTTDGGARDPGLRDRLARNLGLPKTPLTCWSVCRGSMTGWLTNHQPGAAITVEFGTSPSVSYLTRTAAPGIVAALAGELTPVRPLPAPEVSSTSLTLNWRNPPTLGLYGVLVRRGTGTLPPASPQAGTLVGTVRAPGHAVRFRGLTAGTTYAFSLWATDGRGHFSGRVTQVLRTAPGPVTALHSSVTDHRVVLAWTNPGQASFTGVIIRRLVGSVAPATATSGLLIARVARPGRLWFDTTAEPGTRYSYALFGCDAARHCSTPTAITATTLVAPPPG